MQVGYPQNPMRSADDVSAERVCGLRWLDNLLLIRVKGPKDLQLLATCHSPDFDESYII
jgi:hypothetical protein